MVVSNASEALTEQFHVVNAANSTTGSPITSGDGEGGSFGGLLSQVQVDSSLPPNLFGNYNRTEDEAREVPRDHGMGLDSRSRLNNESEDHDQETETEQDFLSIGIHWVMI